MIEPGTPAPDFTLRNHDLQKVSLADLRGRRVLLVFYPADFSPVCTDQLSIYQEVLPQLADENVTVLGISVDGPWAHRAFREKLGIEIDLLSDFHPKGAVAESFGAYLPKWGTANRSLVLIDPDGVVEWVHEAPDATVIPGANLIFDALAAARA